MKESEDIIVERCVERQAEVRALEEKLMLLKIEKRAIIRKALDIKGTRELARKTEEAVKEGWLWTGC